MALDGAGLAKALAPAFAAGFAVQRITEILDPLLAAVSGDDVKRKGFFTALVTFVIGYSAAWALDIRVVEHIATHSPWTKTNYEIDKLVAGLIISAGTEGVNSVLKFVGYAKEKQKAEAAEKKETAGAKLESVNRGPNEPKP
jgi:hypothetical protein